MDSSLMFNPCLQQGKPVIFWEDTLAYPEVVKPAMSLDVLSQLALPELPVNFQELLGIRYLKLVMAERLQPFLLVPVVCDGNELLR